MGAFLSLLFLIYVVVGALLVVKQNDQTQRDKQRRTYRLAFPGELNEAMVTAWIRAISGTLRYGPTRLLGVPTVSFELWATSEGLRHVLKVPWQHADYVVGQLRSLVPGIRVTPEDDRLWRTWTRTVEVGLTHTSRTLRIMSAPDVSASLLASVQALEGPETVLMQWIVTPAPPTHKPILHETMSHQIGWQSLVRGGEANRDEIKDRRDKLDEQNVNAVLRVAAYASTPVRADHLIYRVRASLASTRTASSRFYKRLASHQTLQRRIDATSAPLNFPMQLSASELTALIAWPIGNPFVSGLPQALSRHLPAPAQVPSEGRIIGRSNFPGNERTVAMAFDDARKHLHVIGPTGVGKSVLLANLMKQDMAAGYGVILIENKGDLFRAALDYVPKERINDVIVVDANDRLWPVGFNILNQGDPRVAVDELSNLFDYIYDTKSVWTRELMYYGLQTLVERPGTTFPDLATLIMPRTEDEVGWADGMRRTKDLELRRFWQRFENQRRDAQDRMSQPLMDRIWQLIGRAEIRNIIGQSESSFQMTDVIKDNKILLVNLENIASDTASLAGTLLMNAIWHAVKTTKWDRPTFLYLDEFQDFVRLPVNPEDMLAKARSFGLGMTLAHQHLGQLPEELKQAVLSNARSKVVFQTTNKDAGIMSREFGNSVADQDFMTLGKYEAIARIATGEGISSPLTLTTNAPSKSTIDGRYVAQVSRDRYGRRIEDVYTEMENRYKRPEKVSKRRPDIGSDWQ